MKVSLSLVALILALSTSGSAQTVQVKGIGSSALFLELGLGASSPTGPLKATCVWSEDISSVVATDASVRPSATDTGSAWVAWTPQGGSCTIINSSTQVYGYLETDSVVGNRCLFNGSNCKITYPTNDPAPANLILSTGEVNLPTSIATALNNAAVNAAGTDIRPEDAEFAIARALKSCGTQVTTGSQYLGLGYINGESIQSWFGGSSINVVNFSLPSSFTVTPVGATPVLVVVNGNGDNNGFSNTNITNISSTALAYFLDGTYSYTSQAFQSPTTAGDAALVLNEEPLSGTYNTIEYNVPNDTTQRTSQDVGVNQSASQKNCNGSSRLSNPMNIATASGGARQRAIGTAQELAEVIAHPNSLGYGFWSVANFKNFTSAGAPYAKYLQVDGIDPLLNTTVSYKTYNGALPTTGSAELAKVDLHTTRGGSYPIWSLLRLVNVGATASTAVTNLATAAGAFVSFGTTTSRPDFITPNSLQVVRSHFIPPVGSGEPTTAANGHVGLPQSACTAHEAGGDVGGVIYTLKADSFYCSTNHVTNGHTGQRR